MAVDNISEGFNTALVTQTDTKKTVRITTKGDYARYRKIGFNYLRLIGDTPAEYAYTIYDLLTGTYRPDIYILRRRITGRCAPIKRDPNSLNRRDRLRNKINRKVWTPLITLFPNHDYPGVAFHKILYAFIDPNLIAVCLSTDLFYIKSTWLGVKRKIYINKFLKTVNGVKRFKYQIPIYIKVNSSIYKLLFILRIEDISKVTDDISLKSNLNTYIAKHIKKVSIM